jgi:hypothetical protein
VFLTALYVTGKPEPDWLVPLPITIVIAWHGMRSSLPAFVSLLGPAVSPRLATRALVIGYGAGLAVSVVALAAGEMLYQLARGRLRADRFAFHWRASSMLREALIAEAARVAERCQTRAPALERELREIKARKAKIEAELQAATLYRQRLSGFQPEIGRDLQCPQCWVRDGIRSRLVPGTGTDRDGIYRCTACRFQFTALV